MSYNHKRGRITTGNGASFGIERAGDAHNSYNTHSDNTYGGDKFTGHISGGNVGGRNNSNTIHNNKAGPPREDDTESMEKELERLKTLLAQKKARAAEKSKKAKLAQDLAAMRKELEVFEDAEEDLPQYQS